MLGPAPDGKRKRRGSVEARLEVWLPVTVPQRSHLQQIPPSHSITSSARSRIEVGIVRSRFLAVFRFKTNSNLLGVSTGRSAGLAPCRSLPASTPCWRKDASRLGP